MLPGHHGHGEQGETSLLWTRAIHSLFLTLVQALPMTQLTAWSCLSPSPSQDQMPPTSLHDRSTLLALASPSSSVQPYFRHCPFPLFLHDLVNVTNYSHSSPWLVPRVPLVSRPASPSPASCAPVLSLATLHTIPEMWPARAFAHLSPLCPDTDAQ